MFDCIRETCASPPASKTAAAAILPEDATAGKPVFEEVLVSVEKSQKELENTETMTTMSAQKFHRPSLSIQGMGENTKPTSAVVVLDNSMVGSVVPSMGRCPQIPVDMDSTAAQMAPTPDDLPSTGGVEQAAANTTSVNIPAGFNLVQTGMKPDLSRLPGEEVELPSEKSASPQQDRKTEEIPVNSLLPEAVLIASGLNKAAQTDAVINNQLPEVSKQGEIAALTASSGKERVTTRTAATNNPQTADQSEKAEPVSAAASGKSLYTREQQQIAVPTGNIPLSFIDSAAAATTGTTGNSEIPFGKKPVITDRSGEAAKIDAGELKPVVERTTEAMTGPAAKFSTAMTNEAARFEEAAVVLEKPVETVQILTGSVANTSRKSSAIAGTEQKAAATQADRITGPTGRETAPFINNPVVSDTGSEKVQTKIAARVESSSDPSTIFRANPAPTFVQTEEIARITIDRTLQFATETAPLEKSGEAVQVITGSIENPVVVKPATRLDASPVSVRPEIFSGMDNGEPVPTGEYQYVPAKSIEKELGKPGAVINRTGEQVKASDVAMKTGETFSVDNLSAQVAEKLTPAAKQDNPTVDRPANPLNGAVQASETRPSDVHMSAKFVSTDNATPLTGESVQSSPVRSDPSTADNPASNGSMGQNPESSAAFAQVKNSAAPSRKAETASFNSLQSSTDAGIIDEDQPQAAEIQNDQDLAGIVSTESKAPVKAANLLAADEPGSRQDTVIRQITQKIENMTQNGPSSLKIELHPLDLGSIEIRLVRNQQGVSVTFLAEQPGTGRLLSEQADQLRQSLMDAGVQLSNLNINQESRSNQQNSYFNQPGENSYPRWTNNEKENAKTGGKSVSREQAYKHNHIYSVDYLV